MGNRGRVSTAGAAGVLLALYLAGLAAVAFWPTPVDRPVAGRLRAALFALHQAGLPQLMDYNFVEFSSNILLFVPIGILTGLSFPRFQRGWILLAAALASCCMEAGQRLFLQDRIPSATDIVANTAGAVLGIWFLGLIERRRERGFDKLNQR